MADGDEWTRGVKWGYMSGDGRKPRDVYTRGDSCLLRDVELVILEQSIQRNKKRVGYKGSGQIEIIRRSS